MNIRVCIGISLISLISFCTFSINCVIVDGDKKEDISPVKHQKHNVSQLIDSYNVKTCGISDPDFDEHEFVNMARAGQFPWIVSFQIKTQGGGDSKESKKSKAVEDLHFCCGTFISSKWILSAAHCFATDSIKQYLNTNRLKVVAGSHKVSSRIVQNRNLTIKHIFYHKRFSMKVPIGFDIALVELEEPVKFENKQKVDGQKQQSEPFFNAACLPRKDHKSAFNESARISGWGLSNPKDPSSMPSKLLTTDILLAKPDECAQIYSKELGSQKPLEQLKQFDDFICASYAKTRDACQSDSGGPMMQYVDNKAVVVGIVSFGIGCARGGVPGLYTRTSAYINWIKDITERGQEASVEFELLNMGSNSSSAKRSAQTNGNVTSSTTTKSPSSTTTTTTTNKPASSSTTTTTSTTNKPLLTSSTTTTTTTTSSKPSKSAAPKTSSTTTTSKPSSSSFEFAE